MAVQKIQPSLHSVAPNDVFSAQPTSGAIYTDAVTGVECRLRPTDPWQPLISGGVAVSLPAGLNQLDMSASPCEMRLTGSATLILVYGLIG